MSVEKLKSGNYQVRAWQNGKRFSLGTFTSYDLARKVDNDFRKTRKVSYYTGNSDRTLWQKIKSLFGK